MATPHYYILYVISDDRNVALDGFNDASHPLLNELMKISDFGFEDIIKITKPTLLVGIGWYAYNRFAFDDVIRNNGSDDVAYCLGLKPRMLPAICKWIIRLQRRMTRFVKFSLV